MSRRFAFLWRVLGGFLLGVTLLCVAFRYKNYVLFFPAFFGVCCLLLPPVADAVAKKGQKVYRISRAVFLTLFFGFVVYFFTVVSVMAAFAHTDAPTGCDLIILGSGIDGDQPDIMLRNRLDAAAEYLNENPSSGVVCCGGFGGKALSEAEVMRRYLVRHGISDDRILLDEQSTSTGENIRFAAEIIGDSDRPLAVCSSEFHLYRAKQFAKKEGLGDVYALSSDTPAPLFMGFWFREVFGISRLWILGY